MKSTSVEIVASPTSLTYALHALAQRCVDTILARPNGRAIIEGTASPGIYAGYLITAYEAVKRAEEFLLGSANQLESEGGAPELVALLREKARDERGHGRWIERDLEALGYTREGPSASKAAPAARVYVDFHQSLGTLPGAGAGFLGTAWVLESLSTSLAGRAADNLRAHGASPALRKGKGLTFLRGHHAEDQGHVQTLAEVLERCVIRQMDRDYIELCAHFTATVYPAFFD